MANTAFRDQVAACDARLRGHLEVGEQVLAIGRAEDVTERGGGMSGWTFVMVTNRALRWIMHLDLKLESSLEFASITSVSERTVAHRYTIDLEHHPITRLHHVPAHRFMKIEWGNDFSSDLFTRTSFEFSRRDTAAASALRERLTARHLFVADDPSAPEEPKQPFTPSNGL